MTRCEWILCERDGSWAAALRVTAARAADGFAVIPRLAEVRSLEELAARLQIRSDGLAMIEVRRATLRPVLAWLAEARNRYSAARFVALIERQLDRQDVVDALLEAGSDDIACSPRHLQHLLSLAKQHAAIRSAMSRHESMAAWARSELPWQVDERELR